MGDFHDHQRGPADLESIIATEQLHGRPLRADRPTGEATALVLLNEAIHEAPEAFFQILVETARALSGAHSAGISLLNAQRSRFVWPAIAGDLKPHLWEGTPRDFGPCGVVLDRHCSLLMVHPERHFAYLAPITPALEEVLLVPFYQDGRAVGTLWAVLHDRLRQFDSEDRRLLESLTSFASAAYQSLARSGSLKPILASGAT